MSETFEIARKIKRAVTRSEALDETAPRVLHAHWSPFFGVNIPLRESVGSYADKTQYDRHVLSTLADESTRVRKLALRRLQVMHPADLDARRYLNDDLTFLNSRESYRSGAICFKADDIVEAASPLLQQGESKELCLQIAKEWGVIQRRLIEGRAILVKGNAIRLDVTSRRLRINSVEVIPEFSDTLLKVDPPPRVSIITINFNNCHDTEGLLRSLGPALKNYLNAELLIVDNSNRNQEFLQRYGSRNAIHQEFQEIPSHTAISTIRPSTNIGYDGGNNVAMELAMQHGTDYVLVLNNDTQVKEDLLPILVAAAENHPTAGALGGTELSLQDGVRTETVLSRLLPFSYTFPLGSLSGARNYCRQKINSEVAHTDWVQGCAMMLRVSALREAGRFDGSIFAYGEEEVLCRGFKACGWDSLHVPAAKVWHKGRGSAEPTSRNENISYLLARNIVLFNRTSRIEVELSPRVLSLLYLRELVRVAKRTIQVLPNIKDAIGFCTSNIKGWYDGTRGRYFGVKDHSAYDASLAATRVTGDHAM